jgi:restriction endonuclease
MAEIPKRKGTRVSHVVKRIDASGLNADTTRERRVDIRYADSEELPDILSVLADHTQLTRKTLANVLRDSRTLNQFVGNPQAYIDQAEHVQDQHPARYLQPRLGAHVRAPRWGPLIRLRDQGRERPGPYPLAPSPTDSALSSICRTG